MSVRFQHEGSGADFAIRYQFDQAGECIPEHQHGPELAHDVTCTRGSIVIEMQHLRCVLETGQRHALEWYLPHIVRAAEPDSESVHRFINGQPQGYATLPESELRGTL
jgi:hypothetical protein